MSIRFIVFSIVFSINSIVAPHSLAKDIAIYRWVDENNVVHFSQNQPIEKKYSQLSIFSQYKSMSRQERIALTQESLMAQQDLAAKEEADKVLAANKERELKNVETFKKNCKAAQLNIKMLNSFDKVLYTGDDGISKVLTPEEKKKQLTLSNKHIDIYCEKN